MVLQKKSTRDRACYDPRGKKGTPSLSPLDLDHNGRAQAVVLINEAIDAGARCYKAYEVLKISTRTFRRWESGTTDRRRGAVHKRRSNALSEEEREKIIEVCTSRQYSSLTRG
ncbi:hypothetical protein [Acidithrix ferrooxidans]|uniref:Uncharacterized protein n=1 Tax=Acidithrix ferrooxidans TaxID=1280514 RepID=A0A0D8HDV7_9ACTN|nr:hypothetical protein [Acidithrix ferrooxidans]KJF16145.1 hypothetical protein AXFE_29930 [Acidithrix ferrooxidans]